MATDPMPVQRRYDLQSMTEAVRRIMDVLNLGAAPINLSAGNVPARYQLFPLRSWPTTFATLPSPYSAGTGARAVVTDLLEDEADGGFHAIVTTGGGTHTRPVWCDGTYWRIG